MCVDKIIVIMAIFDDGKISLTTLKYKPRQVSFISIVLYTVPIFAKQFHSNKQESNNVNVAKFISYETNRVSALSSSTEHNSHYSVVFPLMQSHNNINEKKQESETEVIIFGPSSYIKPHVKENSVFLQQVTLK